MDKEVPYVPPPDTPSRVTLPTDLSRSLKSLDDAQLQRLSEAVGVEIDRRARAATQNRTAAIAVQNRPAAKRGNKIRGPDEIPAGKVNLIRASFKAGLKPPAIARTLRISQSLVRRVLGSAEKSRG
jgi:DNA invertase Pin-like site-specific DNA recombinase